jgi:hypothetical protein
MLREIEFHSISWQPLYSVHSGRHLKERLAEHSGDDTVLCVVYLLNNTVF